MPHRKASQSCTSLYSNSNFALKASVIKKFSVPWKRFHRKTQRGKTNNSYSAIPMVISLMRTCHTHNMNVPSPQLPKVKQNLSTSDKPFFTLQSSSCDVFTKNVFLPRTQLPAHKIHSFCYNLSVAIITARQIQCDMTEHPVHSNCMFFLLLPCSVWRR